MPTENQVPIDPAVRIREAAQRSGKPLEVLTARSFLEFGQHPGIDGKWEIHLSSYFEDFTSEKVRELDVLARRVHIQKNDSASFNYTLEVLASCKGFPDDKYPVTFSVSRQSVPEIEQPQLLFDVAKPGKRSELGRQAPKNILAHIKSLGPSAAIIRRAVGFGIFRDIKDANQQWTGEGDKTLWEGLDSALRATLYWHSRKRPVVFSMQEYLVRLSLPILVTSKPWFDIPVDDGKIGDPIQCHWAYISNLYPVRGGDNPPDPMFCLMLSRDKLKEFQNVLLEFYDWFLKEGREAYRNPS